MPGTDVSMALVEPPCSVPGLGSKVSSWLGPPAIQSKMQAICRFLSSSACSTMRSVKLTGSAARPVSPAAPRPSVLRKPRRLTTPSPLIPTWTMFDSNGMAVPLTPGDEFSRVDECPVNVFKDFDAVAHFVHVGRAGFDFLRVGLSRQDSKIKGVQGGPIVRRGRQDLAQHGPWPAWVRLWTIGPFIRKSAWRIVPTTSSLGMEGSMPKSALNAVRGPPKRMAWLWPLPCAAADASPAIATAFLPFCGFFLP